MLVELSGIGTLREEARRPEGSAVRKHASAPNRPGIAHLGMINRDGLSSKPDRTHASSSTTLRIAYTL
ncbi:hypothetical protein [Streptomyces sp. NPDC048436]|uniref:hypothetical protein n=1 Tax=Streptomyces sp. NPDC048436 TaxID=3365550 RepID=UPI0037199CAD